MEFNKKLQELRKNKGLTQEELAEELYVSRTAISKWESGRGYPNIESLKAVAKFFSVTIDELISGDKVLDIAEKDSKEKENRFRDLVFGMLDCSVAIFFFLPIFGQNAEGVINEASLLTLTELPIYLKTAYYIITVALVLFGIIILALRNCNKGFYLQYKSKMSLALNVLGVLIFIISSQPYAATFLFMFLTIKTLLLIKW